MRFIMVELDGDVKESWKSFEHYGDRCWYANVDKQWCPT